MGVRAVFLVGFMGSGKNTVGQELARRLCWDFVDLDARIEERERQTVPDIFRSAGEPAFRRLETEILASLLQQIDRNTVVALGGGAFVSTENQRLLAGRSTIFLDAPLPELWKRCLEDRVERPLRKNWDQFCRLHAERLPAYRQASVTIETSNKDVPAICDEIARALNLEDA